jgi:hypothetical protein
MRADSGTPSGTQFSGSNPSTSGTSFVPLTPEHLVESKPEGLNVPRTKGDHLSAELKKAEILLDYAAESGIEVTDSVRDDVLEAKIAISGKTMPKHTAANLLKALTRLAVAVRPETVESLKARHYLSTFGERRKLHGLAAVFIGSVILVISVITFVSNRISEQVKTDLETANGLAAKLSAELGPPPPTNSVQTSEGDVTNTQKPNNTVRFGPSGPPPGLSEKDVITDLQQFAVAMRGVDRYARMLNKFVFDAVPDPFAHDRTNRFTMKKMLEVPAGLPVLLSSEFAAKAGVYQDIRDFGTSVQAIQGFYYGAVANCILPVLYALLGAGAYLLRSYELQSKNRVIDTEGYFARFLIAGIGGLVVGLFNITQGISISPFAVAFLVGYAVDIFFNSLEGLLHIFKRGTASSATPGAAPKGD